MSIERDLVGYGGRPPHPRWPGEARIAVQFVLNIEEGSESSILNGDPTSEAYLHELPGRPAREGERDLSVEGMYEYGSRAGVWRILQLFADRELSLTAFAVGQALELNPEIGRALAQAGHEVAGHGYRWINYRNVPEEEERLHIDKTVEVIQEICGKPPVGWYTGRVSPNTRRLIQNDERFLYTSDVYNDDLPYWLEGDRRCLAIPYTLVNNDMRYFLPNGFATGQDFFQHHRAAFNFMWDEGEESPKMMSIGLHSRISGHPARTEALERFLDHVCDYESVWVCRREEIARHWEEIMSDE